MTFSAQTKREAAEFPMKKPCCRRAFIAGALYLGATVDGQEVELYSDDPTVAGFCAKLIKEQFGREVEPVKAGGRGSLLLAFSSKSAAGLCTAETLHSLVKCEECTAALLRGAFVGGGTVNEPEKKNYHMELRARCGRELAAIAGICEAAGFSLKSSERLGKPTLYSKDSGVIGDFLFYIGTTKQAFAFMNAKIGHEIKNDINRRTNCDAGNIARSTASAAKHLAAIRYLEEHGRLSELGPDLEYTAKMRLAHPEMSLFQLGQELSPPVSKPGLYHRFEKITAYAEKLKMK